MRIDELTQATSMAMTDMFIVEKATHEHMNIQGQHLASSIVSMLLGNMNESQLTDIGNGQTYTVTANEMQNCIEFPVYITYGSNVIGQIVLSRKQISSAYPKANIKIKCAHASIDEVSLTIGSNNAITFTGAADVHCYITGRSFF